MFCCLSCLYLLLQAGLAPEDALEVLQTRQDDSSDSTKDMRLDLSPISRVSWVASAAHLAHGLAGHSKQFRSDRVHLQRPWSDAL